MKLTTFPLIHSFAFQYLLPSSDKLIILYVQNLCSLHTAYVVSMKNTYPLAKYIQRCTKFLAYGKQFPVYSKQLRHVLACKMKLYNSLIFQGFLPTETHIRLS